MGIERALASIYSISLALYPREFRGEFGAEMRAVFAEALAVSNKAGLVGMLRVLVRELNQLPGSLWREHWDIWRSRVDDSNREKQGYLGAGQHWLRPPFSWGEALLGALPFIMILIIETVPRLLTETRLLSSGSRGMSVLSFLLIFLMGGTFLAVLILAIRRRWPLWSATWSVFFCLLALLPLGWLYSLVLSGMEDYFFQGLTFYLGLPLLIAALLYWVTRTDRLRGMLAALPILYYLWLPNLEETPNTLIPFGLEILVKTASTMLVTLVVISILRLRDWRKGLWIILAAIMGVGLGFSYVGIYHGGTLPFSAQGPSLAEVVRSFLPQYLAAFSILIGPLFAMRFREIGRRSGLAGNVAYHLALATLLLAISINLMGIMIGTTNELRGSADQLYSILGLLLDFALGGYIVGLLLLFWGTWRAGFRPKYEEMFLLLVLPLAIPITFVLPFITSTRPVSEIYGLPSLWVIPETVTLVAGLVWLLLSIWLITRKEERPATAVPAPQLV